MQLLRLGHQLFPEVRVGQGDQLLRPLPGGQSLQVSHTIFSVYIVEIGAGIGDDGAFRQGGPDPGVQRAVLGPVGGGQADKALAPLGQVGAQDKV